MKNHSHRISTKKAREPSQRMLMMKASKPYQRIIILKSRKSSVGELGWLGLAGYIVMVDCLAWRRNSETMSVAFGKALKHPGHRAATILAWGIVTCHLFCSIPLPGGRSLKKLIVGER